MKSAYGCHSMASLRGVHHNVLEKMFTKGWNVGDLRVED